MLDQDTPPRSAPPRARGNDHQKANTGNAGMAPDGDTFSDIPPQATPQTGQRPSSPRTGCATNTDVQVLSALRMMECDRAPSHMQARPLLLRPVGK